MFDLDIKLLSYAADIQSNDIIGRVLRSCNENRVVSPEKLHILKETWVANLASTNKFSNQFYSNGEAADIQSLHRSKRLLEQVSPVTSVFGCVGKPLPFMPAPPPNVKLKIPSLLSSTIMEKVVSSSYAVEREEILKSDETMVVPEFDLILGMSIEIRDEQSLEWLPSRVIQLAKGAKQSTFALRVRLSDGTEKMSEWPSSRIRLPVFKKPEIPSQSFSQAYSLLSKSKTVPESQAAEGVKNRSMPMSSAMQLLMSDDTFDFSDSDDEVEEEEEEEGMDEEDILAAVGGKKEGKETAGAMSFHDMLRSTIAEDYDSLEDDSQEETEEPAPATAIAAAGLLTENRPQKKEMSVLATGECIPKEVLEELERHFESRRGKRPRFIIVPNQTSRMLQLGGDEGEVLLSAEEDPVTQSREPEVTIIGRTKKFQRSDPLWKLTLIDAYVKHVSEGYDMILPNIELKLHSAGFMHAGKKLKTDDFSGLRKAAKFVRKKATKSRKRKITDNC